MLHPGAHSICHGPPLATSDCGLRPLFTRRSCSIRARVEEDLKRRGWLFFAHRLILRAVSFDILDSKDLGFCGILVRRMAVRYRIWLLDLRLPRRAAPRPPPRSRAAPRLRDAVLRRKQMSTSCMSSTRRYVEAEVSKANISSISAARFFEKQSVCFPAS